MLLRKMCLGILQKTQDDNKFETPKDDNEDDLDDGIILQISEKDNLYLFKRLEKQINQSTSLITEKDKISSFTNGADTCGKTTA